MNRNDKISLALHKAVVGRLQERPDLWAVPLQNIERWTDNSTNMPVPYFTWREILTSWQRDDIIKLLLSRSQRAQLLRSSSPLTGILSQDQRSRIFKRYAVKIRQNLNVSSHVFDDNPDTLRRDLLDLQREIKSCLGRPYRHTEWFGEHFVNLDEVATMSEDQLMRKIIEFRAVLADVEK